MATINHDFNKIQINEVITKDSDNKVIKRSLMINIREDSVEKAEKLYKDLKQVFNGSMSVKNEDE